jgi:hypothetical protein
LQVASQFCRLKLEIDVEFSEPPQRNFEATLLVERGQVGFQFPEKHSSLKLPKEKAKTGKNYRLG